MLSSKALKTEPTDEASLVLAAANAIVYAAVAAVFYYKRRRIHFAWHWQ